MNLRLEATAQHLRLPDLQLTVVGLTDEVVTLEHPVLKERSTWPIKEFMKLWEVIN